MNFHAEGNSLRAGHRIGQPDDNTEKTRRKEKLKRLKKIRKKSEKTEKMRKPLDSLREV